MSVIFYQTPMDKSQNTNRIGDNLTTGFPEPKKSKYSLLFFVFIVGALMLFPVRTVAQEVQVVTFTHTMRWLNESNFPNYFLLPDLRDSVKADIKRNMIQQFSVTNVRFPEKVGYQIITGFGKPKNSSSVTKYSSGYDLEIYSFLTRATSGYAVFWSVKIILHKEGKIIHEKEVKHEIENSGSSGYVTGARWFSPKEFRTIVGVLIREAMGMEGEYTDKIKVGGIEEKEKEMQMWFPGSTRYLLKKNGVWLTAGNFAAQLVNDTNAVEQFYYKNKPDLRLGKVSLKPILAELFTEITGLGTSYTIQEKERKIGILEFSGGKNLRIEMNWIEAITTSNVSGEVESHLSVPLVGQLFKDTTYAGNFIYEKITQTLLTSETKEKFSLISGPYQENSFGTVVIHRIRGELNDQPFVAEYNELFGFMEIKSDNQTLATLIFQNCNPENLQSFDKIKLSKNKGIMTGSGSSIASPSLDSEKKLEWYPFYLKGNSSHKELVTAIEIMVCLIFGIGNM